VSPGFSANGYAGSARADLDMVVRRTHIRNQLQADKARVLP
jgi:hypothetical protein